MAYRHELCAYTDFVQVIIPVVKEPLAPVEEKKIALAEFITVSAGWCSARFLLTGWQRTNPAPRGQAKAFAALHADIQAFSAKFMAFADNRNVELTTQIKALNDRIVVLNKEIAE